MNSMPAPNKKDKLMEPDIYIKVRFKTPNEGGRKSSLKQTQGTSEVFYSCPLIIDGNAFDCRLIIKYKEIELGKYYEVPVKFLDKDSALLKIKLGKNITLWEGKEIAEGYITKICCKDS